MYSLTQIGQVLEDARRQAGLTQAEMAEHAGLSRRLVSDVENGRGGDVGFLKISRLFQVAGLEFRLQPQGVMPQLDNFDTPAPGAGHSFTP